MKKNLTTLLLCLIGLFSSKAQTTNQIIAKELVEKHKSTIGLTENDLQNVIISDSYLDKISGVRLVYLQQSYLDLPVYNQIQVLGFKDDKVVSQSGGRIPSIDKKTKSVSSIPAITAQTAVLTALQDRKVSYSREPYVIGSEKNGRYIIFDNMDVSRENITAELMWVPLNDGKQLVLAWQIYIIPINTSDYWMVRVNASDKSIVSVNNLTVYCNWDENQDHACSKGSAHTTTKKNNPVYGKPLLDLSGKKEKLETPFSPTLVENVSYRVIPYPAESPVHPGGTPALVTNPWAAAPGDATSLKWHSNGSTNFPITRGNNVWAQEDRDGNNGTGSPATSTTAGDPLTFDFVPDFNVAATQTSPVKNQQFNTTNLFYWNNIIHDLSYLYGFDEVSGNFQASNQGRGGIGNDFVYADAQDGSGTNNANFSTPADGGNGRMQMFLWGGTPQKDGDVDNGVISHEFAHGISNRLTGGPSQAGCLSNAEQMGEGWSDYYGLMYTQNWATSTFSTGFNSPRGVATYLSNQTPSGAGIRSKKYCTNFAINNRVFGATIDAQQHSRGELWCATLWDMTWNIINQVDSINPNLYDTSSGGGNAIALKLVTLGMKLQPCSPGFIDGRNAILQADQILYNGAYSCAIREAFRRRGMGAFASQGSSGSVTDQIADYTLANATIQFSQNTNEAAEGDIITYTTTVKANPCANVSNFLLTDTLPSNVTYVSGGNYNSTTRVVSFPVTVGAGQSQIYTFSVQVNTGSYYPSVSLFEDNVTNTTIPSNAWTTNTTSTVNWTVSNNRAYSPTSSYFSGNVDVISEQKLTTTNSFALGATPPPLTFRHWFNTESTYDGGVLEISTNGGTSWTDVRPNIVAGAYTALMDTSTVLTGRRAWTGSSGGSFIKTKVNLAPYANQTVKFRFRFISDLGTQLEGWYIDNIALKDQAIVEMRATLFNSNNVKTASADTFAIIIPGCASVAINGQPQNQNVCAGGNAVFSVSNTGSNPIYQWQVSTNGGLSFENISGANSATLNLNNVSLSMNNNQYRLIVSNNCPSTTTSSTVTLTVSQPASIVTQPSSQEGCESTPVSFVVVADGTGNTYQWQVSNDGGITFTNIAGATTNSLDLTSINSTMNGNLYRVVISSCNPTPIVSANASLLVNSPANILTQPASTTVCPSGNAVFTAQVTGTTLSYQWQESTNGGNTFTNISGANAVTLTLPNVTSGMSNNQYRIIVTSTACPATVTSTPVTLLVSGETNITAQPLQAAACPGSDATFTVAANGAGLTYQWQLSTNGGVSFSDVTTGGNNSELLISNITTAMQGNLYRVKIASTCSASPLVSDAAILNINEATNIAQQPTEVTACVNSNAVFTASTTGATSTYQWQVSSDNGLTYTNINGATTETLTLNDVTVNMNNNLYRLSATSVPCGITYSNGAALLVALPPSITTSPTSLAVCAGEDAVLSVVGQGTGVTYLWQVSTDNGVTFTDVANATGSTYTINNVSVGLNNTIYHVTLDVRSCGSVVSDTARLTVLSLPVVELSAPSTVLVPGASITLNANAVGGLGSLIWLYNNTPINGQSSSTYTATSSGTYVVSFTDENGCKSNSSPIVLRDSLLSSAMIRPNPNNGVFTVMVKDLNSTNETVSVVIYDNKGSRMYFKVFNGVSKSNPYLEVSAINLAKGHYTLVVFDKNGVKKEAGKLLIQ